MIKNTMLATVAATGLVGVALPAYASDSADQLVRLAHQWRLQH
ncbi:hypothetical protein N8D56_03535 [Devosia sp. A8/3-2]|nr:hypothetical protein N8D56_03535 [Devosia sp. A8/3-2]